MSDTDTTENDAQIDQDATQPSEQADDSADDETDAQDEHGTTDDADDEQPDRRRGVRQRLADAEELAEGLQATLTRQRQAVFDAAVQAAGVDPRLLASAGHSVDSLIDSEGVLHASAVTEVAAAVAAEFKVQPQARRPAPDPLAGSGQSGKTVGADWGSVLKDALSPG